MKKTSLFDTIFYFSCKLGPHLEFQRDIAVILTEKKGAVDIFLNLNYFNFYAGTQ